MSRRFTTGAVALVTILVVAATAAASGGGSVLGPVHHATEATYWGYYDGHKDVFVATDTSSKAQAAAWHINYSAAIGKFKGAPRQFFIKGQISVFGSEPGEDDYNPLWEEINVTWKPGATHVLLLKDDQIDALAKAGKLTETDAHIVLNAPITKVGK
jgi:hypothetical protein